MTKNFGEQPRENEKTEPDDWVANTAFGPAEARTYTDIPYSNDIFEELEKGAQVKRQLSEELGKGMPWEYVPGFEARYKMISKLVREAEVKQILELAAGYSPRGIEMAQDPSVKYVELDKSVAEKRRIIENLSANGKIPVEPNLHVIEGDACNGQDLESAVEYFSKEEPVAIIHEGLLKYLTREKQKAVAINIRQILKRFGGVWITSDCSLEEKNANIAQFEKKLGERKNFNFSEGMFQNREEFINFFEELGFEVEERSMEEVTNDVVSLDKIPKEIGFNKEKTKSHIKNRATFIMKVKP